MDFICVFAVDENYGFSNKGQLPWAGTEDGKYDMKDFKRYTTELPNTVVIMGRKTMESIPNFPLKDRINIVLTRQVSELLDDDPSVMETFHQGPERRQTVVLHAPSLESALEWCKKYEHKLGRILVIGGKTVFDHAFKSPYCKTIRSTTIPGVYPCDTYLDIETLMKAIPPKEWI